MSRPGYFKLKTQTSHLFHLQDQHFSRSAYPGVMERRSRKVSADNDSIVTQAFKVYMELIAEKNRRKSIKKESRGNTVL